MHNIVSKLLIYGDMPKDSILMELSDIIREYKSGDYKKDEIITRIYNQIKRILEVSTDYAFDKNLWHNYLTYLLITNENPFSLTCEKVGASVGTVNSFAKTLSSSRPYLIMTLSQWKKSLVLTVLQRLKIIRQLGNLNLCTIRMLVKRLEI
mgnify:CR=1 FL=1